MYSAYSEAQPSALEQDAIIAWLTVTCVLFLSTWEVLKYCNGSPKDGKWLSGLDSAHHWLWWEWKWSKCGECCALTIAVCQQSALLVERIVSIYWSTQSLLDSSDSTSESNCGRFTVECSEMVVQICPHELLIIWGAHSILADLIPGTRVRVMVVM